MNEIGQLIITGISGKSLTAEEKKFLESENIGGVILFTKNFESPGQLAELINSIQVLRKEYPLFISVDHEGGRVIRFKQHFSQFPPMMELATLKSPKFCFYAHEIMAKELSACGINVNFSPVCDVLTNTSNKVIGDRAFGSDAETVEKFVSAAIRGLQTNGILACAKHFPGHGSTSKDSHLELPIVKKTMEELKEVDLIPFIKAIKSSRVEFVMMGHLIVDCIDSTLPCSLSLAAHKILRDELKYSKIIISDDMQMKAITDHWGVAEAPVMALNAGTDIILYRDMDEARKALDAVKDAIKVKKILNDDVKEKLKRIDSCKKNFLKDYRPVYIPSMSTLVGAKSSQIFIEEITKKIVECRQKPA